MPELAEVEYYCNQWRPAIGKKVVSVRLNAEKRVFRGVDVAKLQVELLGQLLVDAATHGKQMCFRFGSSNWLGVHLGMTGKTRLRVVDGLAEKHDHLQIRMSDGGVLVFSDPRMFGRILYANTESLPLWWNDLPSEIFSDEFTEERVNEFLNRRARSPIKAVLLMQAMFPGIGNWMADEILWRARIRPDRKAGQLEPQERVLLFACIQQVTADALRVIAPDWGTPPNDWLFNHRWKDGGVCPKTGTSLRRESIGGRTTCWSPKWQR